MNVIKSVCYDIVPRINGSTRR